MLPNSPVVDWLLVSAFPSCTPASPRKPRNTPEPEIDPLVAKTVTPPWYPCKFWFMVVVTAAGKYSIELESAAYAADGEAAV